jgi:hypothetical protein
MNLSTITIASPNSRFITGVFPWSCLAGSCDRRICAASSFVTGSSMVVVFTLAAATPSDDQRILCILNHKGATSSTTLV